MAYNKALVRTFTTLRFVHAAQLGRYVQKENCALFIKMQVIFSIKYNETGTCNILR